MTKQINSINFFFDFLSPYSYFAWCWIRENKAKLEQVASIQLTPVNLAPLIHAHGTLGPAEVEPKRNYLMKDCLRLAQVNNYPFQAPAQLPFNALYALRISLFEVSEDEQFRVVDLFYRAAWERGLDLGSDDIVLSLLNEAGFPGEEWLSMVGDKEIRRCLKRNGKLALEYELFGLPSIIVHTEDGQELFWGHESLKYLIMYIEGRDPLDLAKDKLKHFQSSYIAL